MKNIRQKLSGSTQVDEFMDNLEHQLKQEIEEVRKIILSANDKITEHIKWNAPSFQYLDEDRITFHLHGKDSFQLIFHCGSKVKNRELAPNERLIEDASGLLEWKTADRAIMKFTDQHDLKGKEEKLREVITKWLEVI